MGQISIGVDNVARNVKSAYVGVDGIAREVKNVYVGDSNGIARLVWSSFPSELYFYSNEQKFTSIQNCNIAKQQLNGGINTAYYFISMDPTQSMHTYLYLSGVQWSKYSKLTIKYNNKNSLATIGNVTSLESSSNSIAYIYQNTDGYVTETYDISMTDDEYLVIYVWNDSYNTSNTFQIFELMVSE